MKTTDRLIDLAGRARNRRQYGRAIKLLNCAIDLGSPDAMSRLAIMYGEGEGVEQDIEKSIYWDEMAVNLGCRTSMYNLGVSYKGIGNHEKSRYWFERSFLEGDAEAAIELANIELKNLGDLNQAKRYVDFAINSEFISFDAREAACLLAECIDFAINSSIKK